MIPPPPVPPGWKCPRRVGFLFPHDCHRTTPEGCPDCQNGAVEDPYAGRERFGYTSYDYYGDDYLLWVGGPHTSFTSDVPDTTDAGFTEPDTTDTDFTEADGADLVTPGDEQYESDMTGS